MRRDRALIAGSALSILISTAALAQNAPPAEAAPPQQAAPPADAQQQPGYPQQQPGYPPAGTYPQQQPGYPQQQPGYPPAGTYPQPGYPQQQPGYPPPGYPQQPGYPPPGYPQQPGYPPQAYLQPPAPPAGKHGFLPIIYLGVNSFQGDTGKGLSPGFRLGTILGGRVNEQFSINGELTIDGLNFSNDTPGADVTTVGVDLALSPLFHAQLGAAELVLGPKLGFAAVSQQVTSGGQDLQSSTLSGYAYGLNAGAFANVSTSTELGLLVSFEGRKYTKACFSQPGQSEQCSSVTGAADKVLGITGAILF